MSLQTGRIIDDVMSSHPGQWPAEVIATQLAFIWYVPSLPCFPCRVPYSRTYSKLILDHVYFLYHTLHSAVSLSSASASFESAGSSSSSPSLPSLGS
jgi:hypothetical protein